MRIRIPSLKVALTFVFVLLIVVEKIGFRNFLETLDQFENHNHHDSIIVKALNDFSSGGVTTTAKLVESKNHPRPKVEYDLEDEEEDVRGRTTIPSCDNGCVLLFFHIPKTGGTTLYTSIKRFRMNEKKQARHDGGHSNNDDGFVPSVNYERSIFGGKEWQYMKEKVTNLTETGVMHHQGGRGQNSRVQVFEVHGGNNPSFFQLAKDGGLIDQWRSASKMSNTKFFVFSFIREPFSWSLSGFQMMCVEQGACIRKKQGKRQYANATVENLERLIQPNPQCAFLHSSGFLYNAQLKRAQFHPNSTQCDNVWESIRTKIDWIGLVEEYDTTFDLLKVITKLNFQMIKENIAKRDDRLRMEHIVNTTTETKLLEANALDIILYERIKAYFIMEMWGG